MTATSPIALEPATILGALPTPVVVVDEARRVRYANPAAEQFFGSSATVLQSSFLDHLFPPDSPLLGLVNQVHRTGLAVYEHGARVDSHRTGSSVVDIQVSPMPEVPGCVTFMLHHQAIAQRMDHQLAHRDAARSVTSMAAVLAHEVKNPLSGIRGAAQLLEQNLATDDRELTQLICDETDRICALVDRMEMFSDRRPVPRGPVNIHQVIDHVRRIAQAGFASHVAFRESYDPSLPEVWGHRDQLIQVFLNLVKNAAEAVEPHGGEITLATSYRHGLRLSRPGSDDRVHLPLEVTIQDNGRGVAEEIRPHLFDPFVTTKRGGTGLGLSLVAKIVDDHGGAIEWHSAPHRTVFRVRLPLASDGRAP
ncbi:MAG: PAS domain-containing protein [Alphaproteobacteria bacterium]|nr:PAS domain-containing protein [Alphaproteobacteria bacterium]